MHSCLRSPFVGALVAGVLMVGPSVATATPACDGPCAGAAAIAEGTVDVNAGYTLTVRSEPRSSAAKVAELADGAKIRIVCQIGGEQSTGTFGTSRLWDKLEQGGYVSDTYVFTGSDGRIAPDCAPAPAPPPPPAAPDPARPVAPASPAVQPAGLPADVTLTDDYPYKRRSPSKDDKWGFFYRECTSFVAFRLNRFKGLKFKNLMRDGHFSNAQNWDNNARKIGFPVDERATVGSVMVRDSGRFGHVAIVAKVTAKRFFVEEYNHNGGHRYGTRWVKFSQTSQWDHFIHFRT
ncbi:MAG TPA: CHAP domain-containing protein [Solirubrobacteraceae bacterium]|jgi:surface antigen|nr:CHAP domain-containing protein [Solirubrobacteraceae bacterium]